MSRHVLVVLSRPVPGREAEYESWYTEQHLPDVLALPGFTRATRYRLSDAQLDGFSALSHGHLALYEIQGDAADALAALQTAHASGRIVHSGALDPALLAWCFTETAEARA